MATAESGGFDPEVEVQELSYNPEFTRETEHALVSTEEFREEKGL